VFPVKLEHWTWKKLGPDSEDFSVGFHVPGDGIDEDVTADTSP